jgi:hypothetical protein
LLLTVPASGAATMKSSMPSPLTSPAGAHVFTQLVAVVGGEHRKSFAAVTAVRRQQIAEGDHRWERARHVSCRGPNTTHATSLLETADDEILDCRRRSRRPRR